MPLRRAAFLFACVSFVKGDCIVRINNGTIIGTNSDTLNPLKKVCAYMGVPFASPPVGELRFKSPEPAKPWGSMNATRLPNWCPQASNPPPGVLISEDCLYLNIYQPKMKVNLPVMIWFHGGGYTAGSSFSYTPIKLLARGDAILVVAHYRIGILGFLSTGDEVAPGNYALKDQACAIRWVYENIRAFGGNPRQITIFGESAGAASVTYQLLSPLNRGLINGVIAQSGSALSMWAIDRTPVESGRIMAKRVGCPSSSSKEMISCMKKVPWDRFVNAQTEFTNENYRNISYAFSAMTPVVEVEHPGAFISEQPLEIMRKGNIPNIPVMLGTNKHDGSYVLGTLYLARFGPDKLDEDEEYLTNQIVPDLMKFFLIKEDEANRAVSSTVEMEYLAGVNRSSWRETMPRLVDIMSVFSFKSSVLNTAEILSKRGLPVFLYSFEHHSENSLWKHSFDSSRPSVDGGIGHADDLIYLFNLPAQFTPEDQSFSEMICDMWISFGTYGNPTPANRQHVKWPVYNSRDRFYMKLNTTPTVLSDFKSSWHPNGFH